MNIRERFHALHEDVGKKLREKEGLYDSKQLNPRLTSSFTLSGSLAGDSASSSFGRLDVSGNSSLLGNLTIGGNIQIGDSTA